MYEYGVMYKDRSCPDETVWKADGGFAIEPLGVQTIMSLHTSLQKRHKTSLCFLSKQSTLISKMLCIVVMNERVQNSGVGVFKQPLLTG